jgi:glycosyltransferase involved in cell wall biosynthesis
MRATLSVAMIARNEEANLPRTLAAVRWADEIVIVDSGSVDRTPDIARSFGAKHSFNRDFPGHAAQKNVAIDKCTGDWILLLDADEVVSPELAEEIQKMLESPKYEAYWLPRLNLFLSRWMRHGGVYPDHKLRLFKRGSARVQEGVGPHGTPQYDGPKGTLKHDLMHYAYPTLEREDQPVIRGVSLEWCAESDCYVHQELFFPFGISGRARGAAVSSESFCLHSLEIREGLGGYAESG